MTNPWAPADLGWRAVRWLDQFGELPIAGRSSGKAIVAGLLGRFVPPTAQSSGRASVSAVLSIPAVMAGMSAGSSSAAGTLSTGRYWTIDALSAGQATVQGTILQGHAQYASAASAGTATVGASLTHKIKFRPSMDQADVEGDSIVRSGRNTGRSRRVFTPFSSGRVNDKTVFATAGGGLPGEGRE